MPKNNAKLPDMKTLLQAGINPKNGLPVKMSSGAPDALLCDITRLITIMDRQDYLTRYEWFNLPSGLSGDMIERILYYRGQGIFFYMPTNDTFYFLPYALDGNIDVYGRYLRVTPLPFAGPSATTDGNKQKPWIDGLTRDPVYEVLLPQEVNDDTAVTKCAILRDYSEDISQTITPRADLQRALINAEAECLPRLRTALIGMSGIAGMRVTSEDEYSNVLAASKSMDHASLTGDRLMPIIGQIDFQDLGNNANIADVNQFSLAMQLMDNLRLSTLGISNGGLFQKNAQVLQSQQDNSNMASGYILMDGLKQRQDFCTIVNSIFGTLIWCEIAQPEIPVNNSTMQGDETGDGDNQDSQWGTKASSGGDTTNEE